MDHSQRVSTHHRFSDGVFKPAIQATALRGFRMQLIPQCPAETVYKESAEGLPPFSKCNVKWIIPQVCLTAGLLVFSKLELVARRPREGRMNRLKLVLSDFTLRLQCGHAHWIVPFVV